MRAYFFVFYSERMEMMWIMSSEEFDKEAVRNKNGSNVGKRSIWFNGKRKAKETGQTLERPNPRYATYQASDFARFREVAQLVIAPPSA